MNKEKTKTTSIFEIFMYQWYHEIPGVGGRKSIHLCLTAENPLIVAKETGKLMPS